MNHLIIFFFLLFGVGVPLNTQAYSSDINSDQLSSVLNALVDLVTSTTAKILLVLAIIGVGYSTLALGKMNKSHALGVVIGIGIIFSAGYIAQQLGFGS